MNFVFKFLLLCLVLFPIFNTKTCYGFSYHKLHSPRTSLIPLNTSYVQCNNIDFVRDNELDIKIDKRFCDNIDQASDCFDSIIDIPEKTQQVLLYRSFKKIQLLITALKNSSLPNNQAHYNHLSCYSLLASEFIATPEFKELDKNALFDQYLPVLFSETSTRELAALTKIWSPYLLTKIDEQVFFLNLHGSTDQNFNHFLISNFLTESNFDNLGDIEKYKLSLDILNNSFLANRPLPQGLKFKIIRYLEDRDISWDFPSEIVTKFSGDPDFEKLFSKMFKLAQIDGGDVLSSSSRPFISLIASNKTAYSTRCSLFSTFVSLLTKKNSTYSNNKNKFIEDLTKIDLPCISKLKKELHTFNTSRPEFQSKWCPSTNNCSLHFTSDEWLMKFSYCQKDDDCKSLKYEGCERLFVNVQIPREEIELYHKYCQIINKTESLGMSLANQKAVCLDNLCQPQRF